MAVRVDQPGDERLALAVLLEIGAFGALVLAVEQLLHLAVGADDEAGEAHELAVLVERDAVDVIDERVGVRGGCEEEGCDGGHRQNPPLQGRAAKLASLLASCSGWGPSDLRQAAGPHPNPSPDGDARKRVGQGTSVSVRLNI